MEYDKFKILVVGDSGVGKTALVHLLCHGQPLMNPAYTVGCSLDVKLHNFRSDYGEQRLCSLEFFDIGGSSCHENTRSVFYNNIHGLVLVYDCTNSKSQVNLKKWLTEVQQKSPSSRGSTSPSDYGDCVSHTASLSEANLYPFPILVVGTKVDMLSSTVKDKIVSHYTGELGHVKATQPDQVQLGYYQHHQVGERSLLQTGSFHVNLSNYPESSAPLVSRLFSQWSSEVGSFAAERGLPEILLNCNSLSFIAPGCYNSVAIATFYDQVVHGKTASNAQSPDLNRLQWQLNRPADNGQHLQSSASEGLFWRKVI